MLLKIKISAVICIVSTFINFSHTFFKSTENDPGYNITRWNIKFGPEQTTEDTVHISPIFEKEIKSDKIESDESLIGEITKLSNAVDEIMAVRRPSVGPDGSPNILPTPNLSFIPDIGPLRQLFQWGSKSIASYTVCHACRIGVGYYLLQIRTEVPLAQIAPKAIYLCKFFNIATEEVCTGLVERYAESIHFILTSKTDISSSLFCGVVLQAHGCVAQNIFTNWTIELPPPLNTQFLQNNYNFRRSHQTKQNRLTKKGSKINFEDSFIEDSGPQGISGNRDREGGFIKVLQLTDIHLDPDYRVGSNANCDTELCCRSQDGEGVGGGRAGFYGDYRKCDLPLHSLQNALTHISNTHPDIDLIYMTGDLGPHNVWTSDATNLSQIIYTASRLIRSYFPTKVVIPVLGNHDIHPTNLFTPTGAPTHLSTSYIYPVALKAWESWIPKESIHTFLHAGYYEVSITSNFRVIVLNTNLCYAYNFWQIYDDRDPGGQLAWLVKILARSEINGERVHILGHVPASLDECWKIWSKNFYDIVGRFTHVVTAQFYAHTHYDEFQLHYHRDRDGNIVGMNPVWIGASLTPYTELNPGYKIFYVDPHSFLVHDHETWIYNLEVANANPHLAPNWFKLYKATEAYDLENVLPESLNGFIGRLAYDVGSFNNYYRNFYKAAEVSLKKECDKKCRKGVLCRIVTPYYLEETECKELQIEVDGFYFLTKNMESNRRLLLNDTYLMRSFRRGK